MVNGVQCPALIDTGAEVTTVSKRLVYDHNIQDLDVALSVHGASGSVLPCIQARIQGGGGGGQVCLGLRGHKGKYFVHKSNIKVILLIVSLYLQISERD